MSKLISGKDALIALANGEEVQARAKNCATWSICVKYWTVNEILSYGGDFRLKPKTITINGIEVPAPFEPKEGEIYWYITDSERGYSHVENKHCFRVGIAAWRTEEDIKQVVNALRNIFNAP